MKIIGYTAILTLFLIANHTCAQTVNKNSEIQDSLSKLSSVIWKQKTDSARLQASDIFFRKFQQVLESGPSSIIPFDSIQGITRVASADGKFRVFTWNVPLSAGTNKYYGFIQFSVDSSILIPLQSAEIATTGFDTKQLNPQTWYGALYYNLIEVEISGQKAYTLLGWDGYTANSNRKLIDIISIEKTGNIIFGMPVFKTEKGIKTRVVMEYAEKANMLLRYDYQAIIIQKRKKIRKENTWLIVMDRMVPMDPSMEGTRKYYVPSGDTYDGFVFRDGYWVLVENIDVANKTNIPK
jgi:hypothetical protein